MSDQPTTHTETTHIEWGVQWHGDPEIEQGEPHEIAEDGGEAYARRVAEQYRYETRLVQREVRRGPWTAAQ